MIRTQVYLTQRQRDEVAAIAKATGKRQSEVIREALDVFIDQKGQSRRAIILREAAGMWRDRKDPSDLGVLRFEWDRNE